eukprot:2951572-Pyramimonas_sp.AAC.1
MAILDEEAYTLYTTVARTAGTAAAAEDSADKLEEKLRGMKGKKPKGGRQSQKSKGLGTADTSLRRLEDGPYSVVKLLSYYRQKDVRIEDSS